MSGGRGTSGLKRETIRVLYPIQEGICSICYQKMAPYDCLPRNDPKAVTVDHVKLRATGGSNDVLNITLAHADCNGERNDEPATPQILFMQAKIAAHYEANPEQLYTDRARIKKADRQVYKSAMRRFSEMRA